MQKEGLHLSPHRGIILPHTHTQELGGSSSTKSTLTALTCFMLSQAGRFPGASAVAQVPRLQPAAHQQPVRFVEDLDPCPLQRQGAPCPEVNEPSGGADHPEGGWTGGARGRRGGAADFVDLSWAIDCWERGKAGGTGGRR